MVSTLPTRGVLRVVPPAQLEQALQDEANAKAQAQDQYSQSQNPSPEYSQLAGYIRNQFDIFQRHRNEGLSGWTERMLSALRTFNGIYDQSKLMQIRQFGGSEVYARIVAMKCRGANSLLRDVYLAPERPWAIQAPSDPDVPQEVIDTILQLVQQELLSFQMLAAQAAQTPPPPPVQVGAPNPGPDSGGAGGVVSPNSQAPPPQPPDANMIRDRVNHLMEAARNAEKKNARKRAAIAQDRMEEILDSGGFYKALSEVLQDVPLFPFGCIKGPIVRVVPDVSWQGNAPQVTQKPRLFWERVSPFDLYWTPGVSDIENASVIERIRLTRAELNDLLDLPGYNQDAVRSVLENYGKSGITSNWDTTDSERAVYERRENPQTNESGMIDGIEFHGNIQGSLLLDYGMSPQDVPDPLRDYMVQLWQIGEYVIKVQITPSPRKRHPFFITSFEKVPGTPVGNGLPDILADIQEVANATIRALVNNLCLTGETVVYKQPQRQGPKQPQHSPRGHREMTLKQVVEQDGKGKAANNGGRKPIYLRVMDEATGELIAGRVEAVHDNGVQDVFRIKTAGGYEIKATGTHKFYMQGVGWRRVAGLGVGDFLGVNGTVQPIRKTCVDCGTTITRFGAQRCRACAAKAPSAWNMKQAREALSNRNVSGTTARNRKLVKDQKKDHCEQCGSLDRLQIHHLDKDPWNCNPSNLKTFCEPCHKAWHVRHDHFGDGFKHMFVDFDRIVSIEHVGKEQTYCLTMQAPNHNFVANGFISGNSIASGPQVDVNVDRLAPGENPNDLFPWKRWKTLTDPMGGNNSQPAIRFFQPNSNAQELLTVYKELNIIADDISAIPKYMSGGGATGGAGRTASGLAMLMGNASKILQTVAANIDRDIMFPALQQLFDMLMLTDQSGVLKGDEHIRVMGVNVAMQRETQRARQLEFLSITANPLDAQIIGTQGRAKVLRTVSDTIGLDGEDIVPPEDELQAVEQQQKMLMQQQAAEAQGSKPGKTSTGDSGPRTNIARGGSGGASPVAGGAG
jgi:hypothetical protein